ncbi:MAG: hypothetical protein AB1599_08420 [Planctomycetota bacterium]
MSRISKVRPGKFSNLYQFIRLVLGGKITDYAIAQKWGMDAKNFSLFKNNVYPVPRFERLVSLARILDVDDHFIYEVAKGVPAGQIYYLVEKLRLKGVKKSRPRISPRSMRS